MSNRRMNAAEKIDPARGWTAPGAEPTETTAPSPTAERKPDSLWRVVFMFWVGPILLFIIIGILKWVFGF